MSFGIVVRILTSSGPEAEHALPTYRLPMRYDSVAGATAAAEVHVTEQRDRYRDLDPGSIVYDVVDDAGNIVGPDE